MKSNNLFNWATSELSQDAVFAWIISWADPVYRELDKELHKVGQDFVKILIGGKEIDIHEGQVCVKKQFCRIDVLAEINNEIVIVIEDKIGSSVHGGQLKDYYTEITTNEKYNDWEKYFVYIKTENEPDSILKQIKSEKYSIIERYDLRECLNNYNGNNSILIDYKDYLKHLDERTSSFSTKKVNDWDWYNWQGFYKLLDSKLVDTGWGDVSNPNGGFLGFWWHWSDEIIFDGLRMYLQLEQGKLCFKIECINECYEYGGLFRNLLSKKLLNKARNDDYSELSIAKPYRFGYGSYMTIAIIEPEVLFGREKVNIDEVLDRLKKCERLVDEVSNEASADFSQWLNTRKVLFRSIRDSIEDAKVGFVNGDVEEAVLKEEDWNRTWISVGKEVNGYFVCATWGFKYNEIEIGIRKSIGCLIKPENERQGLPDSIEGYDYYSNNAWWYFEKNMNAETTSDKIISELKNLIQILNNGASER